MRTRLGAAVAMAALVLVSSGTGAGAATTPAYTPVWTAPMAGHTEIHWSGTSGMLLTLPEDYAGTTVFLDRPQVSLQASDDTTYAFVGIFPQNQDDRAHLCDVERPRCFFANVTYFANYQHQGEFSWIGAGGEYPADRPIELYLITDGTATLTLELSGPSGAAFYTPTGQITGGVEPEPGSCPTAGCDTDTGYASSVRFGGTTVDLGEGGFAASYAYARAWPEDDPLAPVTVGSQLDQQINACVEPNLASPDTSPYAEDHPWGCDSDEWQVFLDNGYRLGSGIYAMAATWGVDGPRYLGFQAASVGTGNANLGGYAVWYHYGIAPPALPEQTRE